MLKPWLRRLFSSPAATPARSRPAGRSSLALGLDVLEDRIALATLTWTGAVSNLWSNAANWQNEQGQAQAPAAGDDLIINSAASNLSMNNDTTAGTNYRSLTYIGTGAATTLSGNAFTLGDASGGGIFQNFTGVFTATISVAALTLQAGSAKTFTAATAGSTLAISSAVNLNGADLVIGQVANGAGNVRFQAAVNGTGNLTKVDTGIVIFASAASYNGTTTVSGGTLQLGAANVLPNTTSVNLNNIGATFDLAGFSETIGGLAGVAGTTVTLGAAAELTMGGNGASTTFSGLIVGGGSLVKAGGGTLTLEGNNTYTGTTAVSGGVLAVNGTQTQSNVTVRSSGTLGGNGTVGNVTVETGGRIDPGVAGPGTLNTGIVTFQNGSSFAVQLNGLAAGQFDQLDAGSGNVTLGSALLTGSLGFSAAVGDSFIIVETTGTISGNFSNGSAAFLGGRKFSITYSQNSVVLTRIVANASVALTSSQNPSVVGENVTFTAIVTPEAGATGVPTGTVEFYDGGNLLGSSALDGTGRAQFTTNLLPLGSRQITARYLGNADYNTAESAIFTQNVNSGQVGSLTIVQGNNQTAQVNTTYAQTFQVLVRDVNGLAMTGVVVSFAAPTGTGPGGNFGGQNSIQVATDNNGIATATLFTANTKAGGFQVLASVGTLNTQFNLTNTAAAAAKLAILQQPTSTAAGSLFNPVVRVGLVDEFDNLTTSTAQVTVALGANPGSDTLQGTLTVNAVGGVAAFSDLKLRKAATGYTLVFSSTGLANQTSNAFNITAGAVSKLVITMANRVRSGRQFELTVTAQDEFGNTNTGYTGTVNFSNNKGTRGLPANYTFTAADAGVRRFNVTPAGVGRQTITVKDTATGTTITPGTFTFFAVFGNRFRL